MGTRSSPTASCFARAIPRLGWRARNSWRRGKTRRETAWLESGRFGGAFWGRTGRNAGARNAGARLLFPAGSAGEGTDGAGTRTAPGHDVGPRPWLGRRGRRLPSPRRGAPRRGGERLGGSGGRSAAGGEDSQVPSLPPEALPLGERAAGGGGGFAGR